MLHGKANRNRKNLSTIASKYWFLQLDAKGPLKLMLEDSIG